MKGELTEVIRRLESRGAVAPSELPRLVTHITGELADLIRLSGKIFASTLDARSVSMRAIHENRANRVQPATAIRAENGLSDRVALKIPEAAKMLGLSRSTLYQMIGKREIGILRIGERSVRIPKAEIERLLNESLVPPLLWW